MLSISLSLTVTFLGGSSLQILTSALPRCITVTPILCALTCLDPIVVTVSWDMSVWMISPVQVSSQVYSNSSRVLCVACIAELAIRPCAMPNAT